MAEPHSEAARVLGERVRSSRQKLALSQEDVAALSDMHVTNVGKIERGQSNPSLTTLLVLAGALNADPGEWVGGLTAAMVPGRSHTSLTAAEFLRERAARRG